MKKKKLEKVLNEAVSWIVEVAGENVCRFCSYYNPKTYCAAEVLKQGKEYKREKNPPAFWVSAFEAPPIDERKSCSHCRRRGNKACRQGVIRYFAKQANVPKSDIEDCELSRIDLENRNRELRREVAKLKNEVYFTKSQRKFECEKAYFEGRDEGVKKTKDSERLQVALQVYALMTKEYEGHVPPLVADKIFDVIKPQQ